MAKKDARIPINKFEALLDDNKIVVPLIGADNVNITIRHTLPLKEVLQFVEDVVSLCTDMDEGTYTPEVMYFGVYSGVLTYYANFTLPKDVERQYELIYGTNAVNQVMAHINRTQYDEIVNAIRERIEFNIRKLENALVQEMQEIARRMTAFAEQSEELFSGVNADGMTSLFNNLANVDQINEKALVQAVFEAEKERQDSNDVVQVIGIEK